MERSISSLTYKGSISEAIVEARRQKKLLVVYISGDDENSINLEQSTWMDLNIADAITKHCIFLHLVHGTVDASHFAAIFPQKSVPSVSAVGYNGVMLWNHEGYISAENFVDSVDKACASLQLQETAATLLTAALASRKPESFNSGPIDVTSADVGNSSSPNGDPSPSIDNKPHHSEDGNPQSVVENGCQNRAETHEVNTEPSSSALIDVASCDQGGSSSSSSPPTSIGNLCKGLEDHTVNPELVGAHSSEHRSDVNEKNDMQAEKDSSEPVLTNDVKNDGDSRSSRVSETVEDLVVSMTSEATLSSPHLSSLSTPENINLGLSSESSIEAVRNAKIHQESLEIMADEVQEGYQNEKTDESIGRPNLVKSTDVHLNIRLLDGSCLQAKFPNTDTLKLVKNYVSEKQKSSSGSYDLAVPYPRRVFNEEDMDKTLSNLGFGNREALIVIPHRHSTVLKHSQQSSPDSSNVARTASDDNSEGYFGYLKRLLSYFNPLAYIGGAANSSTSEQAKNDNLWQYGPNSSLQDNSAGREASYRPYSPSMPAPPTSDNSFRARKQQASSSGSNIRTLRDIEDDGPSSDRNMYWNGNSTEFGGDDKKLG